MNIRQEEYSTLGDFIKTSFLRDQPSILLRYPKMNSAFATAFSTKLEQVKTLQASDVVLEAQKNTTRSLYDETDALNNEMGFLQDYFEAAQLGSQAVIAVKKNLKAGNIEGAVNDIEAVLQLILAHFDALEEEGMAPDFIETLTAHKISLGNKNAQQNQYMNTNKGITESNDAAYSELYDYIVKIANAGKKVFQGKVAEDEYSITQIVKRMRAAKRLEDGDDAV